MVLEVESLDVDFSDLADLSVFSDLSEDEFVDPEALDPFDELLPDSRLSVR